MEKKRGTKKFSKIKTYFVIIIILLLFIILFNIIFTNFFFTGKVVFSPSTNPNSDWKITKFDGAEKELFEISKLTDNQICLIAKDNKNEFDTINFYEGKEKKLKEVKDISKLEKKNVFDLGNEECFNLDREVGYYQIGENSIIIQLTNSYTIYPSNNYPFGYNASENLFYRRQNDFFGRKVYKGSCLFFDIN